MGKIAPIVLRKKDTLGLGIWTGAMGSKPFEFPKSFGSALELGRGGDPGGGKSYSRSKSYAPGVEVVSLGKT